MLIPMAALVAVMIMVSIGAFDWGAEDAAPGAVAIGTVVLRFRRRGVAVEVVGLNEASATILTRLAAHDKPDALDLAGGH